MNLNKNKITKLETFLSSIAKNTYPEPILEPHLSITKQMIDRFFENHPLPLGSKILDIGCGQGPALEIFTDKGFKPIGITLNEEDATACKKKGFTVFSMDQSFLDFPDNEFDFVWCRHCLEHSVFPYFTLQEIFRVLKNSGYLYVEVPAPDTSCGHQTNNNHYSVLGKSMWSSLMIRTGFNILECIDISFEVPAGPDVYWAYTQQKP